MEQKKISDLTVVELKSIAYDQMAQIENAQNNLKAINQELSARLNPTQTQAPAPPEYKPEWTGK